MLGDEPQIALASAVMQLAHEVRELGNSVQTVQVLHRIERKLDAQTAALARLSTQEERMSQELDDLKAEVTQVTTVQQSAITLIQGIAQKLQDAINANDPAALVQLKNDLDTSTQALAAAVAANTPAQP